MLQPIINGLKILLDGLYQVTGSYGWAIILFSVVVKLALYYPTRQQYQSMKKMQLLQPEMQKIQNLYKDDPQKMQAEQMMLFKKHNVNPLSGCLPLLIQFPFLWAIFKLIESYKGEFENQTFLWIGGPLSHQFPKIFATSLAVSDIPLLLLYGYSMYMTSKLGSVDNNMGASQVYMTIGMPILFTYMMWKWNFPSALVLYWRPFNLLSIIHQSFMMREESIGPSPAKSPAPVNDNIKKGGKSK